MKYKIHTITVLIFFLLVLFGLAFNHFTDEKDVPATTAFVETNSPELPTIMRMLMIDMHTINEGIFTQNFHLIEQGAANINNHPPLSDETRSLVQNTLGERMSQFGAYDKVVHDTADSLREAAVNQDMNRIMKHTNVIQQGCVSCHAAFQEEIRHERLRRQTQNRE